MTTGASEIALFRASEVLHRSFAAYALPKRRLILKLLSGGQMVAVECPIAGPLFFCGHHVMDPATRAASHQRAAAQDDRLPPRYFAVECQPPPCLPQSG